MRVLVTGIGGLLGGEVARQLLAGGCEVRGCDLRRPPAIEGLEPDHCVAADVTQAAEVMQAVAGAGADAIFHAAGLVGPIARRRPYGAAYINVAGTLNLLEAARLHGVGRFVLCSTALVYDEPAAARPTLDEAAPVGAAEVYGGSKQAAEALVGAYAANFGFRGVSLRFARLYGPVLEGTEGGAMQELGPVLSALLRGREVTVPLPVPPRRADHVYVRDAARASVAALTLASASGPYNVASFEILSLAEILDRLEAVEPAAARLVRRHERPGRAWPDPLPYDGGRAARELGYTPRFPMREGLADILATLREGAQG